MLNKQLKNNSAQRLSLMLCAAVSVLLTGCSMFKEKEEPPAPVEKAPVARVRIEQSATNRDITTGERKFVFCSGDDCPAASKKVAQQAVRVKAVAAPAVVAEPNVKTFQVGFDYDKSTLNADGIRVMTEAADFANSSKAAEIRIHGKADTYNRDAYNLALAERRAKTAERFLKGKKVQAKLTVDASIVRVTEDGRYPPGETFKGRRVDLDIVIEVVSATK